MAKRGKSKIPDSVNAKRAKSKIPDSVNAKRGKSKIPDSVNELLSRVDIAEALKAFEHDWQSHANGLVLCFLDDQNTVGVHYAGLTNLEALGVLFMAGQIIGRSTLDDEDADEG